MRALQTKKAVELGHIFQLCDKYAKAMNATYIAENGKPENFIMGCYGIGVSRTLAMVYENSLLKNNQNNFLSTSILADKMTISEEKISLDIIDENVNKFKDIVNLSNAPRVNIGTQCFTPYKCEFLGHCWKKVEDNSFLHTTAFSDKDLFSLYNSGIQNNKGFKRFLDPLSTEMYQLDALEQDTFYINYKKFYDLIGKRTESVAFLNILFYSPAIPLLDGHKPYQEIISAFSILSNESGETTEWNCFDDYSKMEDGLKILTEELKRYEKVVYFSPQNINLMMQRYNIIESKDVLFKIINLKDVLKNSDFFYKKTKYDFSLKTIYEGLFPSESIFEHSRIILNATSDNELERILVGQDMEAENKYLQKAYKFLLK